ncbi:MAG: IS5 family transposase [Myxococcales bacterium]|nr:IS5 family transposase [Myxococcales bacterium]
MRRHALTDDQWARIEPLLPTRTGPVSKIGDRAFIDAVLYRAKTGVPWRDLPDRFGPWKSIYNRFANWSRRGVWELLFAALNIEVDDDEDDSIVDASVVRAHQDAAGGKGGSKQMLWDALEEAFRQKSTLS